MFPLFFVFLFLSSMALPRDMIEQDWFQTVATLNPFSYLIEGVRSLFITGFDGEALALAFGFAIVIGARLPRRRGGVAAAEDDAHMTRRQLPVRRARGRLAQRPQLLHQSGADRAGADVPAVLLHGVRGRAVAHRPGARVRLRAGLHGLPVRVRAAAGLRVRRRVHRLRDRARLRVGLRPADDARRPAAERDPRRLRPRRAGAGPVHLCGPLCGRARRRHERRGRRRRPRRADRARPARQRRGAHVLRGDRASASARSRRGR